MPTTTPGELPGSTAGADTNSQGKPPRAWPAILTLFFLAPVTAEVLSGSTPPIAFLTDPTRLIFNPLLYGCGALLIREVARRRGLGWASIVWMGAAYGVFEEGLVINTWANPWMPQVCNVVNGVESGLCDYSRVGGINLLWALSLTTFHALVSITIPILLVELAFPRRAARPWLGRKAIVACVAAELLCLALGILLSFSDFRTHHQDAPLLAPYVVEAALMTLFIALALTRGSRLRLPSPKKPPRLWTLRVLALLGIAEAILSGYIFKGAAVPFALALGINLALLVFGVWRVGSWSRRQGWNERHMLALASGTLGFFLLLWDPLLELSGQAGGLSTRGIAVVALAYLIVLVILARRTARRLRPLTVPASPIPLPVASPAPAGAPPPPPPHAARDF